MKSASDTPRLATDGLRLAYQRRIVIDDLDLEVPQGKITVIVGPNACGKSTLLHGMARLHPPGAGKVILDGRSIHSTPTRQVARKLGLLPQSPQAPEGLTVVDLVGRGRAPHQSWWRQWSAADEQAVDEALRVTDMTDLAQRPVDELSGGQRQRAWIAMAVAQQTPIMLLDEPTTFLDLAHQIDVLDLIFELNRTDGRTIVMVLHDLNQASRYADHMIVMKAGLVMAAGQPSEVISAELVEETFGVPCEITVDPVSDTPLVIPAGRHHRASQPIADLTRRRAPAAA
ncbi:ABC transporter ATP-binding protein [Stackebrandtia nassauensis]|uniref:ABC transporter related protein n=1 Tax=Stackebrandtia nassauensis (strain DSM 44728 / CIP 108903 / NRRL B-16338 / NBRC 102104 / LLR-40K-21) TaxID=446470 RepID=D3PUU4_STANL|nr:ABC transporter ATP-binding protein [Stackebrandtia nassauensis]ADD44968.1 ABC transporter related protein [Stackebrandtia nassauensis DSM 44728]